MTLRSLAKSAKVALGEQVATKAFTICRMQHYRIYQLRSGRMLFLRKTTSGLTPVLVDDKTAIALIIT